MDKYAADQTAERTLERALYQMQQSDPNGDYYSYLEDLRSGAMSVPEIVDALIEIIERWRDDLEDCPRELNKWSRVEMALISLL